MDEIRLTPIILATLSMAVLGSAGAQAGHAGDLHEATEVQPAQGRLLAQVEKKEQQKSDQLLLQAHQKVLGKVEAVTSDQIKVNIGEVQPRFLPLKPAQEKNFPTIKPGDDLIIILNEQNLIVDYHPLDSQSSHKILRGKIADTMPVGHDRVVIKGADGKEQSFKVRSQVRSKLAAIPVGTPAIFLIDETNQVTDATFASVGAARDAHKDFEDKSSIKGAQRQIDGTVVEPLRADHITLKTEDGERPFEVRGVMHERISKLQKGESVILLVDNENKVIDIAVPTQQSR